MSGVRACGTTEEKDQERAPKILNVAYEIYVKKRVLPSSPFLLFFPVAAYMLNLCVETNTKIHGEKSVRNFKLRVYNTTDVIITI